MFVGPKNAPLRRGNFTRIWRQAIESAGLPGFHIHDLRHTGNHIAATTGASLRELMGRMGHSTTRAALIYLHGSDARQRAIADGLNRLVQREMKGGNQGRSKRSRKDDRARGGHADKSESNDPKE